MNQERKRLSDCPVKRLAQCRGEVGVLARIDSLLESRVFLTDAGVRLALAGHDSVDLVGRAHVTRLQAEVSALQQRLNIADQLANDLQVELAKSRRSSRFGQIG